MPPPQRTPTTTVSLSWVGLAVALLAYVALLWVFDAKFSPADVRAACVHHRGAAQVVERKFSHEAAIVVCRDGSVAGIK